MMKFSEISERGLRRFHRSESGAIALAALAGLMILFMTTLIIYDAGQVARDKIDAQNAADTAAYSMASVKARTMNMVAYTNVAKRSIVGMHNIYWGAWIAYVEWVASRCKCCSPWNIKCCIDCVINIPLVLAEGLTDTIKYIGHTFGDYADDIEALDNYQAYMSTLTPWWGWSEGALRAGRNGATIGSSFPPPPGLLLTMIPDWIDMALNLFGFDSLYNHSYEKDGMPLTKLSWSAAGMCFPFFTSMVGALEYQANVMIHQSRSQLGAAKSSVVYKGAYVYGPTLGCLLSFVGFGTAMFPRAPNAPGSSPDALLAKSNTMFAYQHAPEHTGQMRNKFNFMSEEYSIAGDNSGLRASGYWALSRGEFFTPGEDDPDPWKTQWTAKLRPVNLPGEQPSLGFDVNAMFHDTAPYLALAGALGLLTTPGGVSWAAAWDDAVAMEKMTRTMGNGTINGLAK